MSFTNTRMLVVGLSGGLKWDSSEQFEEVSNFLHDAAAVVVRDGQVIAALGRWATIARILSEGWR